MNKRKIDRLANVCWTVSQISDYSLLSLRFILLTGIIFDPVQWFLSAIILANVSILIGY